MEQQQAASSDSNGKKALALLLSREEDRCFSIGDSSDEETSQVCGACQPNEQVEEDSSKEATAKGSSGVKSTTRSKFKRTTYRVTSKGAAGRLFGEETTCVKDA